MLVLKYQKQGSARFISHIELLRHTSRIIRRAQIPVNFSNGFNPHALVFFSPPLVLGVGSNAEYIAIDANISKEEIIEKYNNAVTNSLRASEVFECEKNPNLQGKIVASDYVFPMHFEQFSLGDKFIIEYDKKGTYIQENVYDKIFGVYEYDGKTMLRVASGNVNLRPDRILPALNKTYNLNMLLTDVNKIAQYICVDGKLVNVDEVLR